MTAIIYLSVIGWAYLLGSILALVQDKGFQAALVTARFGRAVAPPARALLSRSAASARPGSPSPAPSTRMGTASSPLDADEARVLELDLGDFATDPPGLAADVSSPETLMLAGLGKRECRGVLALTPDDRANLAIAVTTRLLHPGSGSIGRAQSPAAMDAMATCGVAEIINPYREFAERLAIAMRAPDTHRLLDLADRAAGQRSCRRACRRRPGAGSSAATAASARRWRARSSAAASTSRSSTPTSRRRRPRPRPGLGSDEESLRGPASPRPKASSPAATTTSRTSRWRWRPASSSPASS